MVESFDMSGALRFDLAKGRVSLATGSERAVAQVVLPAEVLTSLWRHLSVEQSKDFGQSFGNVLGARVAGRLGGTEIAVDPEVIVEHLGGELALAGLGSLTLESWGQALVFGVVGSVAAGDGYQAAGTQWLAAVLESALIRIAGRDLAVVALPASDATARFVICNREASRELEAWLAAGCTFGEIVVRLNQNEVPS
jgi:hypothetical protein